MTILGHIWTVITNLVATVVILAMFSRTSSPFETMVIAGLTLIYIALVNATTLLGGGHFELMQDSLQQFARIAELLKDEEVGSYHDQIKELDTHKNKLTVRLYINSGFSILFWGIAIVNILRVL